MTTEINQGRPESATADAEEQGGQNSLSISDLQRGSIRALSFVRDFPWLGLGVLSTCVGASVMFVYFRSIAFTPPDLSAVLGAGAAIGVVMFAYLVFAVSVLAAPHWLFSVAGSLREVAWRPWRGGFLTGFNNFLLGAQLLAAGLLFSFVGWTLWSACSPVANYAVVLAASFLVAGSAIVAHAGWGRVRLSWNFLSSIALLLFLGALQIVFLMGVLLPSTEVSHWHAALWLFGWLSMVAFMGRIPNRAPAWAPFLIASCLLPLVILVIPVFSGHADAVPKRVMELSGVRSAKVVELRVPTGTCELIVSAMNVADLAHAKVGACADTNAWSVVNAQVLSNLGSRWWIEVTQVGALVLPSSETLRISIPSADVQVVQRRPLEGVAGKTECVRRREAQHTSLGNSYSDHWR